MRAKSYDFVCVGTGKGASLEGFKPSFILSPYHVARIVNSCKINGIDSYCYLKDVITKLRKKDYANLEQLLPDIWLKNQLLKL